MFGVGCCHSCGMWRLFWCYLLQLRKLYKQRVKLKVRWTAIGASCAGVHGRMGVCLGFISTREAGCSPRSPAGRKGCPVTVLVSCLCSDSVVRIVVLLPLFRQA